MRFCGSAIAIHVHHVGLYAIGALPHVDAAFVADLAVAIARVHLARGGLQGIVAGEHLGVLFLVLVGKAAGGDVAFGEEVAGALIEAYAIGGGGAGGIPHARAGVEQDDVLVGIHGGFGGARLAVAFFVGEIAGLLHAGEMAGLGVEARLECRGWWWC